MAIYESVLLDDLNSSQNAMVPATSDTTQAMLPALAVSATLHSWDPTVIVSSTSVFDAKKHTHIFVLSLAHKVFLLLVVSCLPCEVNLVTPHHCIDKFNVNTHTPCVQLQRSSQRTSKQLKSSETEATFCVCPGTNQIPCYWMAG